MSKTSDQEAKTYGYQQTPGSERGHDAPVAAKKQQLLNAFEQFIDALVGTYQTGGSGGQAGAETPGGQGGSYGGHEEKRILHSHEEKKMSEEYRVGSITVPEVGAGSGVFIRDLVETEKTLFVSTRVIRDSGIDTRNGELVRYKVNPQEESLADEIEPL